MLLRHPPTLHAVLSLAIAWVQCLPIVQVVFYVVQHIGMPFIWCGLAAILLAAIILDWDRLA